jgi:hypothetical protein
MPQASPAAEEASSPTSETPAAPALGSEEALAKLETEETHSAPRAHGSIYRTADILLWLLNRPLESAPPKVRGLLATVSLLTIAIATSAMLLLPSLLPPRDPISLLTRQVAALPDAPATTPPEQSKPPEPAPPE